MEKEIRFDLDSLFVITSRYNERSAFLLLSRLFGFFDSLRIGFYGIIQKNFHLASLGESGAAFITRNLPLLNLFFELRIAPID